MEDTKGPKMPRVDVDWRGGADGITEARFFIRKQGAYYRQNERGYTTSAILAGLYTQEQAEKITHPNGPDGPRDGMSYIAEHICPDEDWQAYRAIASERDTLRRERADRIAYLEADNARLREVLEIIADGDARDYTDNYMIARAALTPQTPPT